MQNVSCARKHAACAKRGKIYKLHNARENMETVPSAGKHATVPSEGKLTTCTNDKNMQPILSTEKHATCTKQGKTYKLY